MFVFEGLKLLKNASPKKCDYFKKSSDVQEQMKETKSVLELISKLENGKSNLRKFSDEEIELAKTFFVYNNYYKFSIFPKLLPTQDSQYTFMEALSLYELDSLLKRLLSPILLQIEFSIKARLASKLAEIYESSDYKKAECYLDSKIYVNDRVYNEVLMSFSDTIKKSKEPFIKHHHKGRNGCIPLWVLTEEITFGQVDHFISSLEPTIKKNLLIEMFDRESYKFLISWISFVRHLRNITAHNARLVGRKFVTLPKLKREQKKIIHSNNKNELILVFVILKEMILFESANLQSEWNQFLGIFSVALEENSKIIDYELNGFYDNWIENFYI